MITLVIGKPDSGKSKLAEDMAVNGDHKNRYYIATMMIMDEAGEKRVEKHRKMRENKGFITLEIPHDISTASELMDDPEESVVVLECIPNLVGNAMHDDTNMAWMAYQGDVFEREFARAVTGRVTELAGKVCDMIVVSAHFDPDPSDDEETVLYKRLVDTVNNELRKVAGKTVEV